MALKYIAGAAFVAYRSREQKTTTEMKESDVVRKAICILDSQPNEVAKGVVHFSQAGASALCEIEGSFTGLSAGKQHGFHIH